MSLGRLALVAALALPAAVLGPAWAADTAPPAAAPVTLTLTGLEPRAPAPGDDVTVRGMVRNTGKVTVGNARVRLRVSTAAVGSRSALAAQASSTAAFGSPVSGPDAALDLPDIPAGGQLDFSLRAPVSALGLPGLGVYPFGMDLRGDDGDGIETLSRLRTWLPFGATDRGVRPTSIAWLWPLVDVPDRNPDGSFPSDALAEAIQPTGRLGRLLTAASAVSPVRHAGQPSPRNRARPPTRPPALPLTYALDPALLEALSDMADGYSVGSAGKPVRGSGSAGAAAFLRQLRTLTGTQPVLALPYADPDLPALVRAGRAPEVGIATGSPTFARQLVQRVLGTAPLEHIAWPPGGLASQAVIDAMTGVDTVVLSGTSLPALTSLSYTPDAATTLPAVAGGMQRALVSDPTLDALVATDPAGSMGERQAEQRFLAETLLITAEQPAVGRAVVVAPPRRWAPSASWASALLRDSASVPWLRPARLTDLRPVPGPASRGPLIYPESAQRLELPASVFGGRGGVRQLGVDLANFRSILSSQESAAVSALDRALLRCESAAWRTQPRVGRALRQATQRALADLTGKVRITTKGTVSLASKKSTIPISIANGLSQPVRVQVALDSTAAQLIAEDTGVKVISGGHQIQLSVGLQAPGSGVFPITASLLTPEGQPYGTPVDLHVYSSRYGTLALAITVGAVAVLTLIAAARLGTRLRAAHRRRREPAR